MRPPKLLCKILRPLCKMTIRWICNVYFAISTRSTGFSAFKQKALLICNRRSVVIKNDKMHRPVFTIMQVLHQSVSAQSLFWTKIAQPWRHQTIFAQNASCV